MKRFFLTLFLCLGSTGLVAMDDISDVAYWARFKVNMLQKLGNKIEQQEFFIKAIEEDIEVWEQRCAVQQDKFCKMLALLQYMRQLELQKLQQRKGQFCKLIGKSDSCEKS